MILSRRNEARALVLAAAQTRMVYEVRIRLDSRKSVRPFKVLISDDVSEFESYHLSHAVGSLWRVYSVHGLCGYRRSPGTIEAEKPQFRALRRVHPSKWRAAIALKQAETAALAAQDAAPSRPKKISPKPNPPTKPTRGDRASVAAT
jgi:hypothetical protein